jgi:3-oxoacyl-[acyl-carrier protein] reductase
MAERVLISGGTQGLGRALSLEFGRAGYTVAALYRADHDAAEALAAIFRAEGLSGGPLQHDVTRDAADLLERTGTGPGVLIHNAVGRFEPKPFHLIAPEEIEAQFAVAAVGLARLSRLVLPAMVKARRGTIVAISTAALAGPMPPKGFSAYAAAKAAQIALLRAIAAEYRERGVRCFSVSPGFMDTKLTAGWHPALRERLREADARSEPATVAAFVRALVERADLPALGEDYFASPHTTPLETKSPPSE